MTIAVCPACKNTGAVGERYCTCESAQALRARIDADPRMELLARIEKNLGERDPAVLVKAGGVSVLHETSTALDRARGRASLRGRRRDMGPAARDAKAPVGLGHGA